MSIWEYKVTTFYLRKILIITINSKFYTWGHTCLIIFRRKKNFYYYEERERKFTQSKSNDQQKIERVTISISYLFWLKKSNRQDTNYFIYLFNN